MFSSAECLSLTCFVCACLLLAALALPVSNFDDETLRFLAGAWGSSSELTKGSSGSIFRFDEDALAEEGLELVSFMRLRRAKRAASSWARSERKVGGSAATVGFTVLVVGALVVVLDVGRGLCITVGSSSSDEIIIGSS